MSSPQDTWLLCDEKLSPGVMISSGEDAHEQSAWLAYQIKSKKLAPLPPPPPPPQHIKTSTVSAVHHRLKSSVVWASSHCTCHGAFNADDVAVDIQRLPRVDPQRYTRVSDLADAAQHLHPLLRILPDRGDRIGAIVACNMPENMHEVACDMCIESYIDVASFEQWLDGVFEHDRPYSNDPSRIITCSTAKRSRDKSIASTKKKNRNKYEEETKGQSEREEDDTKQWTKFLD